MSHDFSLALGLIVNPLTLPSLLSAEGGFAQVNYCVFLQFTCDPHASSREERGVLVTCVLSLRVFFQTYACCMDTFYTFIQGHEKPSDCLGLDQKSTEFLY